MGERPIRVRLSRAKGFRMPANTVKVDRTTPWGNPFIVGKDGNAAECVYWFILMCCGFLNLSHGRECCDKQDALMKRLVAEIKAGYPSLRDRNLACWCEIGKPCHADVLLTMAANQRQKLDLDAIMAGYGYRMVNGRPIHA